MNAETIIRNTSKVLEYERKSPKPNLDTMRWAEELRQKAWDWITVEYEAKKGN